MSKVLRKLSQTAFLLLFIFLMSSGKISIWMAIFLITTASSFVFGRFYCGWICPINTVINFISKIKNKFQIKNFKLPGFIKRPIFRYLILAGFFIAFGVVMATGKKLPVLPTLFAIAIFLTIFFPESLWHRYLCPYGAILHFTGKMVKRSYKINDSLCISCGICNKVCPSEAAEIKNGKHFLNPSECLICGKCAESCPKKAISYNTLLGGEVDII